MWHHADCPPAVRLRWAKRTPYTAQTSCATGTLHPNGVCDVPTKYQGVQSDAQHQFNPG
jgi:hypothetical protein